MGEKHSKNKSRGITLIALIITIIVMLILVSVSVQILINSNLIGIAENAGNKTKTAYNQEANMGGIKIGDSTYNSIDEYMQSKCTHEYGEWTVVKEATYQEAGERNRTCTKCGLMQTEYPSKLACEDHTYSETWEVLAEATCQETGLKQTSCTKCGTTKQEEIEIDEVNGHNYVEGTCTVCGDTQPLNATLIASVTDKTAYYGKTVNYTCGDTVVGWKIFYAGTTPGGDVSNIYLIADDYIAWDDIGSILQGLLYENNTYNISFKNVGSNTNYTDGTGSTRFISSPAKNWLKYARSTSLDRGYGYTSTNDNMKVTAMMLDTTVWTQYCNSTYADYAIGGPTLDMFVASWNQTQTQLLYYNATADSPGYYIAKDAEPTVDDTSVSGLTESNATNQLYIDTTTDRARNYWIMSPSGYNGGGRVFCVGSSGSVNAASFSTVVCGLRPVVCLSSNVTLTTDSSLAGSCDFGLISVQN